MQQPRMSRYMKHVLAPVFAAFGRLKEVGLPKWKALIKAAIQFARRFSPRRGHHQLAGFRNWRPRYQGA